MRLPSAVDIAALDLAGLVRPGDTVVVGQGTGEPQALTEALVAQRAAYAGARVFVGPLFSDTFAPERTEGLAFSGYGAISRAGQIARAGRLDPVAAHYSALPGLFADGVIPADVVMLQLTPGDDGRPPSLGMVTDYLVAAARRARLVIAQVNAEQPWTFGGELPDDVRIDICVEAARPPVELAPARVGPAEEAIAAHVAALVPDGAVIEIGIGAMPDAILSALMGHRDLGFHSGMISDRTVDLIEAGVITNARKPFDTGITIAGCLFGGRKLFRFADRNPALRMALPTYTHGHGVLARLPAFVGLNSAVEVDLTGQINAEVVDGAYVGGVGGQVDFVRGALASPGGRSVIALPATARKGSVSRIVPALTGPVTTPRSDADTFVTEFGVAELKGLPLAERARRMIAIADPAFREDLERQARALFPGGFPTVVSTSKPQDHSR
ncbi:acetyl-CoA hydrolase/transferase family protein [Chelatococcus reniformis]|uniref:4-hydroxybutyrate CoA-transferase n=1 Tax=Chelatococcus reniformis TaxID=1494448 RepID=A0A916XDA2_9HYPH|nr:acetyl-CoA hydrolase/transferase family protein [Chelatococcus reniformis]GGC63279.1 4-hydroxybutyrate CoA-transferase [Chelatococcus reniformis]